MSPLWLTFILTTALATESQVTVSAEVAQLEAAVLEKYGGETSSGAEQTSNATLASNASAANAEVPPEVAQLEAAVLAKYGEDAPAETTTTIAARQSPGLSIRKLDEPVPVTGLPSWQQASSLSLQGFEELMQAGSGCVDNGQCPAVEEEQEPEPEKRSSFNLFKSSAATPEAEAEAAPAPAPAPRKKAVMADMPGFKHHGAHMVHVEPTERRSPSGPLKQEEAEKIRQKPEVSEDVFHSRTERIESTRVIQVDAPPQRTESSAWSFFRTVFFSALLLSGLAVAYHKFEVILRMSDGKGGFKNFKAKREDDFGAVAGFGHDSWC